MENMGHVAPEPPTSGMGGGSGEFDLIRPPPRSRAAESGHDVDRDVVDETEFDPSMPLSVLIVKDTDVCEYTPPFTAGCNAFKDLPSPPSLPRSAGWNAFYGPHFSPVFPAAFVPHFFCRRSQSFVRLTKNQNKNRRQILDHAAAADELLDASC